MKFLSEQVDELKKENAGLRKQLKRSAPKLFLRFLNDYAEKVSPDMPCRSVSGAMAVATQFADNSVFMVELCGRGADLVTIIDVVTLRDGHEVVEHTVTTKW